MLEQFSLAFATLFATIGPVDVAAVYAALASGYSNSKRKRIAFKSILISTCILGLFAIFGEQLLASFGISIAALKTAGGILLLIIGIQMVFAQESGATSTTEEENTEAEAKQDISVFPMATPMIAGPGAISAIILLMADASTSGIEAQLIVIFALAMVLIITLILLLLAGQVSKLFGVTGIHVITRLFGMILAALAVQFLFDGLAQSPLFIH